MVWIIHVFWFSVFFSFYYLISYVFLFDFQSLIWKKLSYYEMPFVHLNNKYKSLHKYIQTNYIMIKIITWGIKKMKIMFIFVLLVCEIF